MVSGEGAITGLLILPHTAAGVEPMGNLMCVPLAWVGEAPQYPPKNCQAFIFVPASTKISIELII